MVAFFINLFKQKLKRKGMNESEFLTTFPQKNHIFAIFFKKKCCNYQ